MGRGNFRERRGPRACDTARTERARVPLTGALSLQVEREEDGRVLVTANGGDGATVVLGFRAEAWRRVRFMLATLDLGDGEEPQLEAVVGEITVTPPRALRRAS